MKAGQRYKEPFDIETAWQHKRPRSLPDHRSDGRLECSCLYLEVYSFDPGRCGLARHAACGYHATYTMPCPWSPLVALDDTWTPEERQRFNAWLAMVLSVDR